MTRLRDLTCMDWVQLHSYAEARHRKVQYRKARCEHGKTRQQTCVDCEGGYVQDTSTYASLGNFGILTGGLALVAESDDGEDVAFLTIGYR